MVYILILALALLGLLLYSVGRQSRTQIGLPTGEVIYSDTREWEAQEEPLLSRRHGLVGRPDYLVRVREGIRTVTIPVEVKSRPQPPRPYDSHLLQLATYCLLVEDVLKERPPYGILRYADATLKIPFTDELRRQVLANAGQIRSARRERSVHRQHHEPQRCLNCGYRHSCGEEILPSDPP